MNNTFPFANFKFSEDFRNKSWVQIIEEEENRKEAALSKKNNSVVGEPEVVSSNSKDGVEELKKPVADIISEYRKKETSDIVGSRTNRKRVLSVLPTPKMEWAEPNKGWCWKKETIVRREKEIHRMKERSAYLRYIEQVPRSARKKNVHPRTPNKFINWSRRSWDKQVKMWKLAVYEWVGESPTSSVYGSYCSSECSDEERSLTTERSQSVDRPTTSKRVKREEGIKLNDKILSIPSTTDNMASLLGHFDLDTLREAPTLVSDESTLKAIPKLSGPVTRSKSYASAVVSVKTSKGPTDFSHLILKKEPKEN